MVPSAVCAADRGELWRQLVALARWFLAKANLAN